MSDSDSDNVQQEIGFLKLRKSPHTRNYSTRDDAWQGFIYSILAPSGKRVRVRQKFLNIYSDNAGTLIDGNSGAMINKLAFQVTNIVDVSKITFKPIATSEFFNLFANASAFELCNNTIFFYTDEVCTKGVGISFKGDNPEYFNFEL